MSAKDEIAWVIEFPADERGVLYYGKTIHGLGTTSENLDAIRFARKQDADLIIEDFRTYDLIHVWDNARAVEHMWIGDGKES